MLNTNKVRLDKRLKGPRRDTKQLQRNKESLRRDAKQQGDKIDNQEEQK